VLESAVSSTVHTYEYPDLIARLKGIDLLRLEVGVGWRFEDGEVGRKQKVTLLP